MVSKATTEAERAVEVSREVYRDHRRRVVLPVDPNAHAMRQWEREQGHAADDPMTVLREAVAEKRMGRRAGWR